MPHSGTIDIDDFAFLRRPRGLDVVWPQTWNGLSLDATGMYPFTFVSEEGCDSLVTIDFTLNVPSSASFL